ncbi:LacI family transcriptional regulator [Massilia sp. WF1]|uniref:LacI family DNA-binding transcriptional regulator n=1 Tax=unclassified Massilia TaxID=2609279 RepID=UPI00068D4F4F|nr:MULTISPECIES: LacI family DNA-binding transcriptional regulator [unclassified Massilia]ALK97896.1 LacI family transcriptional regulator [Massilia sp. WG5]KNZ67682.1 LacI family transcriptional regulator [Massilia sp. WF1]
MSTIKDVARLAGVGLSTASRVVRGQGSVSQAKLERVRQAVAALGYQPSHAARSLLYGSSRMIGVYIPLMSGTFYTAMLQIVDSELRGAGLHMMVAFGVARQEARRQAIDGVGFLLERGCDGVIVLTSPLLEEDLAALGPQRERLVLLNHSFGSIPEQCFTVDHRLGGRLAARALLDHQHREIAIVSGPADVADNVERIEGFMHELAAAGIDTGKLWMAERDFSSGGGWSAAQELLASKQPFSAVFCANDEMALGALACFHEAGLRVPQDVSVIGYDDVPSAAYSAPRLTSVHIPWREMTRSGVAALLNLCYGHRRPLTRTFPVSVSLRASLARPPSSRF